jgi:hypothetical protein
VSSVPFHSTPAEVLDAVLGLSWIFLRSLIATVAVYALVSLIAYQLGAGTPWDNDSDRDE